MTVIISIIGYKQQILSEKNYDIEFNLLNIISSRKSCYRLYKKDIQLQIVNVTVLHKILSVLKFMSG